MSTEAPSSNFLFLSVAVIVHWGCSLLTVFINKNNMSTHATKLDSPFFITWYQSLVATIFCVLTGFLSRRFTAIPSIKLDFDELRNIFPLSITFVVMVTLTNFTIEFLTVSTLMIVKSTVPIFVMLYSLYIFKKWFSKTSVLCGVVILIGFAMGIDQTNLEHFDTTALAFALLAASTMGLYLTVYQRFIPTIDNCVYKLTFYNNLTATIVLFIVMIFNGDVVTVYNEASLKDGEYWRLLALPGILAYFANAKQHVENNSKTAGFISFLAKLFVQTVIATYYYNETHTALWWASNAIITVGLFMHYYFDEDNEVTEISANEKYKLLEHEFNSV
ncbi:unnamed protein product [Caenorhabditis angaria]|uniref:EamA domain-containing protein n=1 Tax=Caenorhabditis angaria TaxID=860376 RepID=A0A9P1NC70_9PELO|nr:unnamed protein product [Caenorhabditis angaria]